MGKQRDARKKKSLASGRPPLAKKESVTFSSKATRSIIRKHHTLLKEHEKSIKAGNQDTANRIAQKLRENGGLEKYQHASQIGQLTVRGGDTSQVLVSWLQELGLLASNQTDAPKTISILEVGCLSPGNAISKCSNAELTRIDLRSTHPEIAEQDFMQRPLPSLDAEKFDIISLSLVLNFVADAPSRGQMLRRTTAFLRTNNEANITPLPALFLTLPLPCVANSRYFNIDLLTRIMSSIGYGLHKSKSSTKIYYSLWQFDDNASTGVVFKKTELLSGSTRNNFYIAMD